MADDVKDELKALVLRARQEKQGPFPETLRQRLIRYAVERWKAGVSVRTVAAELGVSGHTLSYWKAQAIHIADEADKVCSACGGDLREWTGQFEESEEIDIVERRFVIKKHKRQKYRCQCGQCIETAPGPMKLFDGARYAANFAIAVAVAGIGESQRIFEPFFRSRSAERREGAGLGLSIAREIARAHGGDIILDGEGSDHGGACFVISMRSA